MPNTLPLLIRKKNSTSPKNVVGLKKSLPVPEMEQLMLSEYKRGGQ